MGVPVGPLALLVAVEMLPDLMRTLGNVTLDVAVTAVVDAMPGLDDEAEAKAKAGAGAGAGAGAEAA